MAGRARRPLNFASVYWKGGERMGNQGYAGKIGNAGSQKVEAPFGAKKTAKGAVHKGDLRDK